MPTTSALDIGSNNVTLTKSDYLAAYSGATPPASPKNTPFQNFITAYFDGKVNEQHISIERRNGDWIAAELNSSPQSANCSALCGAIGISGNAGLCTPSTYSVSGFTGTAIYSWTASPTGVVSITPIGNGSQATISKNQNGNVTIFVTISSSCGGTLTVSKNLAVGAPVITSISSTMTGSCNGLYQEWNLSAAANSPVSSWLWTVDNPANNDWIIYSPNSPGTYVAVTGGGGITITATNSCGAGKSGVTIWSNCQYSPITASPNPATNNVTIAIDKTNGLSSENIINSQKGFIYKITIIDQLGEVKKQYSYPAGVRNTNINLTGLVKGMYTVQAFDGTSWNSVKIIKE